MARAIAYDSRLLICSNCLKNNFEPTDVDKEDNISTTSNYRIFEDDNHNILFRFRWEYDGNTYTVPYQNVIHIKSRYNKKRFMGTSPDIELKRSLDLIETSGETIKNIVNRSNSLMGYLKYNNIADDEELKQKAKEFQDAYMNAENAGGLAAIDNTMEFKEITQRTPGMKESDIDLELYTVADDAEREELAERICNEVLFDLEHDDFVAPVEGEDCFQTAFEVRGIVSKAKGARKA